MDDKEDAIVIAVRAETKAEAAMDFMMKGFERIERGIEALRSENTSQHAEGRRNLSNMAKGLHRRLDDQDKAREKLREDVSANLITMSKGMVSLKDDVDESLADAGTANTTARGKLHDRIDTLIWAMLLSAITVILFLGSVAVWLFLNPQPVRLPIA